MQKDELKSKCDKFGIALPDSFESKIAEYVELIKSQNYTAGLLAPAEIKNIYERHILDSLSILLFRRIDNDEKILDFGSGGGLPGIVLSLARPDAKFILAESLLKKASFLESVISLLNIHNASVFSDRAEKLGEKFDLITIRATGPLTRTISQSIKLLKPDGEIALWTTGKFLDKFDYWKKFCQKRNAVIQFEPYPKNWIPEHNFAMAFIELA